MKHMKSPQLSVHYIPNFEERGLKAAKYFIEKSLQEARKKNKLTGQVLVMESHIQNGRGILVVLHRGVN